MCQVLNYFVIDTIEVDSTILGVRSQSALQNLLLLFVPKSGIAANQFDGIPGNVWIVAGERTPALAASLACKTSLSVSSTPDSHKPRCQGVLEWKKSRSLATTCFSKG